MRNHSFHDSWINQLTILNNEGADETEVSPVSVKIHLAGWNKQKYELLWENVNKHSTDFDIKRNQIVGTGQILFEPRIIIECKLFFIKTVGS